MSASLLDKVKMSLRVTTTAYDIELTDLIASAKTDLGIAGVELPSTLDEICETAIKTYCKCYFGEPDNFDRLKALYDEQKAQLSMATGYTEWIDQT